MKKSILAFLIAAPMLLASCIRNNGLCYVHKDQNLDGICDVCNAEVDIHTHQDKTHDGKCDICELEGVDPTHFDEDKDGKCDVCGIAIVAHEHTDTNADGKCDICGCSMEIPPKPIQPCEDGKHTPGLDGICTVCGADCSKEQHTHIDADPHDGKCDICGAKMEVCTDHYDGNHDGFCDYCGTKMEIPSEVTVYLVLTSVGLYKGNVGNTVESMYLENAVTLQGAPGDPLPGKEDVTHAYNSKAVFTNWLCYEGKGAPTVYTTFPYENNKVLYANFVADGYNPVPGPTPGPDPTPVGEKTFYLYTNFQDGSSDWTQGGEKFYAWAWSSTNSGQAYSLSKVSDSYYSYNLPENTTGLLFVRVPEATTSFDWNTTTVWNQTSDLNIEAGKTTAQITCWHNGGGESGPSGVIWVA